METLNGLNLGAGGGLGSDLLTGFGTGLQKLAQHKLNDILEEKEHGKYTKMFQEAGYDPKTSSVLSKLYRNDPRGISGILNGLGNGGYGQSQQALTQQPQGVDVQQQENQQQSQPQTFAQSFGRRPAQSKSNDANDLKKQLDIEKYKDKIRPELTALKGQLEDIDALVGLLDGGKVEFGTYGSLLSQAPFKLGNVALNSDTVTFNTIANKFVDDSLKGGGAAKSVHGIKLKENAKPGIDKTAEQNRQILNHYKKSLSKKINSFYKSHPLLSEENILDQEHGLDVLPDKSLDKLQLEEGPHGKVARNKLTGELEAWNAQDQEYNLPIKKKGA